MGKSQAQPLVVTQEASTSQTVTIEPAYTRSTAQQLSVAVENADQTVVIQPAR